MSREDNVELVRAGYDAFNRREFDRALEAIDESTTWRPFFSVETDVLVGKEAIRAAWERQTEALDVHIEVHEVVPLDDTRVLALATWTGRGSESGARTEQRNAQLFKIENGRLRSVETFSSKDEALEASGLSAEA
jgi:ketosteroid isomerase-like protein